MRLILWIVLGLSLWACAPSATLPDGSDTQGIPAGDATAGVSRSVAIMAVNRLRSQKGLSPLRYSTKLQAIAQSHANDMARRDFFSHTGSDGQKLRGRLKRAGYKFCAAAENLAYGASTTSATIAQWRASPGHYRTMLGPKYQFFGLARAPGDRWVMVLATPAGQC